MYEMDCLFSRFESKKFGPIFKAKRIDPAALNAHCDPKLLPLKPVLAESPLSPTEAWENEQVDRFTELRNRVHNCRMENTREFCISPVSIFAKLNVLFS